MDILSCSSIFNYGRRKLIGIMVALLMSVALTATAMPQAVQAAESHSNYGGHYHWVVKGDSLSKLARRYSVTVHNLASANGLSATDYLYVGQKIYIPKSYGAPNGCKWHHYVKSGDTLSHIAKYYGVDYAALARANHIQSAHSIYVGQKICVPEIYGSHVNQGHNDHVDHGSYYTGYNGHHVVKHGETLAKIARHYGLSTYSLAKINHIGDIDHIYVGQHLRLHW